MGKVGRILVTGVSGFVGQAVVAAARQAGLEVIAPRRAEIDLASASAAEALTSALAGCHAVVHLAAAMGGDAEAHERGTVNGTRVVLQGMKNAGVGHLVLVSSLAVHDVAGLAPGQALTSETELIVPADARDAYAAAKLKQELLASAAELESLSILRPGIVFDEAHLWNAHLGVGLGPALVRFPARTGLAMCHVQHLADRIVRAVAEPTSTAELVVDPELPSRGDAIARLRESGWPKVVLPFPWIVLRLLAGALTPMSSMLPRLLKRDVLEQRLYPMGRVTMPKTVAWPVGKDRVL